MKPNKIRAWVTETSILLGYHREKYFKQLLFSSRLISDDLKRGQCWGSSTFSNETIPLFIIISLSLSLSFLLFFTLYLTLSISLSFSFSLSLSFSLYIFLSRYFSLIPRGKRHFGVNNRTNSQLLRLTLLLTRIKTTRAILKRTKLKVG